MKSKAPRRMLSTASSMDANAVSKTTDRAASISRAAIRTSTLRRRQFFGPSLHRNEFRLTRAALRWHPPPAPPRDPSFRDSRPICAACAARHPQSISCPSTIPARAIYFKECAGISIEKHTSSGSLILSPRSPPYAPKKHIKSAKICYSDCGTEAESESGFRGPVAASGCNRRCRLLCHEGEKEGERRVDPERPAREDSLLPKL